MTNLTAIASFEQLLISGEKLDTKTIASVMDYACGGTAAEGRWQMKTATDLVEGAVASRIKEIGVDTQKLSSAKPFALMTN